MTKLSRVQKERLAFIVTLTALLSVILYQMVITPAQDILQVRSGLLKDWQQATSPGKSQPEVLAALNRDYDDANAKIRQAETSVAAGDPYRWLMKTLPNFYEADPVDLLNYEPPAIHDWQIYPKVPYRAVTFTVSGTAYYHDLGRLLMAIENSHPYVRIRRLDLEPKHSADPDDKEDEKLNFRLEFDSMLRTNTVTFADPPVVRGLTSRGGR
ncbi:MAG TPA: hypothetical protein VJ063_10775 [Verrucomicrobiae bacterium]|nr:hypothetical protein [Verrucomicrobiae bacterium]